MPIMGKVTKSVIGKETTEITVEYGTSSYDLYHNAFMENEYSTLYIDGAYNKNYKVIEEKIFQIDCNKLGAQFTLRKKKVEEKESFSYSFLRGFYDAITTGKCCTFNSEAGTQAHNDYIRGYRFGAGRDE